MFVFLLLALLLPRLQPGQIYVSALPACAASLKNKVLRVADSSVVAIGSPIIANGHYDVMVKCDGTNWLVYAVNPRQKDLPATR